MTDRAPRRILVLGGTGTIGRATARVLVARGHDVVCLVRRAPDPCVGADLDGAELRLCDVTDPASLARDGIRGERFDVVLSCLASRTGAPEDAWRIDHDAHVGALKEAKAAGIPHMILLSAICVQKPKLEFQRTKLAFETKLIESGIDYTIVRPTAFFKSLSGQVERVRQGKRFVMFGDGTLTACKPISDDDLAAYLADCIDNPERRNRILAIGGPGEAITPRMQGEQLFAMLGQTPRFRQVPVALLDAIILALATAGRFVPALRAKAELARIGRYYATESMLVLDPETGRYDADATPSTGSETLFDYYRRLLRSEATAERGEHAVF
ncbi:NAD-dependent epimerase/dehydratase family protein [Alteriqipengyuania lutimaris]|uniref:Divinyl chlorophyllide a 8-vinyl-reductase, chloroplastic n=2 Tax=Alteriqipengyuania lutimaris TaxID=1538146 RepID=A0A395LP50_9SPHN|nr:NAD-dependent epimerase/dehydratase family protein [Alteriqipengyuania lutimaris]